jgi:hypothetical protein
MGMVVRVIGAMTVCGVGLWIAYFASSEVVIVAASIAVALGVGVLVVEVMLDEG